jgi:hypothetical protein
VRLVTGSNRAFSLSSAFDVVYVPYPVADATWTRTTVTCGVALQCSPSKERVLGHRLGTLSARELMALTIVETRVAIGWIIDHLAGLWPELERVLTSVDPLPADLSGDDILTRAIELARTKEGLILSPLIGCLPRNRRAPQQLFAHASLAPSRTSGTH